MIRTILLGPPGAGKGTQAAEIVKRHSIPHISTGDIFRANIKNGTELGKKAKAYMDRGELVPDDLTCEIATTRLLEDDCKDGFILDGFPRTVYQAEKLDEFLAAHDMKLSKVVNLQVADEVILNRMTGRRVCSKCGATYNINGLPSKVEGVCDECGGELIQRADDNEETVRNRLSVYHEQTAPLIEYYTKQGIIADIDGAASFAEIADAVDKALGA